MVLQISQAPALRPTERIVNPATQTARGNGLTPTLTPNMRTSLIERLLIDYPHFNIDQIEALVVKYIQQSHQGPTLNMLGLFNELRASNSSMSA